MAVFTNNVLDIHTLIRYLYVLHLHTHTQQPSVGDGRSGRLAQVPEPHESGGHRHGRRGADGRRRRAAHTSAGQLQVVLSALGASGEYAVAMRVARTSIIVKSALGVSRVSRGENVCAR